MNRRWLLGVLPDPADVRRYLGLGGEEDGVSRGGRDGASPAGTLRRWLRGALREPALWFPTRRSVAGGVAVGLFVGWLPVPLQMLLAAVLASVLRVHVPVSVVMVWFTNPLTIGPLLYAAWRTGSILTGQAAAPASMPAPTTPDGASLALASDAVTALTPGAEPSGVGADEALGRLGEIWPALLSGCLFLGTASAVCGFVLTRLLWRVITVRRWRRRPANRPRRLP